MCAFKNSFNLNVLKYVRGMSGRSKTIRKIRDGQIKKKLTFKKRMRYCPRLRQKPKNRDEEKKMKKTAAKSSDFKSRIERKEMFKKNARNRRKKENFQKYPIPNVQKILSNIAKAKKIRENRRRGRIAVSRDDSSVENFCAALKAWK